MVFSHNQVRQLYVASGAVSAVPTVLGNVYAKGDTGKTHFYIQHLGQGGLVRSDLINVNNVLSVSATKAAKMTYPLKRKTLTLDATVSGQETKPIAGQDYVLELFFTQYIGLSEEDTYLKFAVVHATSAMTNSDFYKAMALSIVGNMQREQTPLCKVYLGTTEVTKDTKAASLTGTYTGIIFEEVAQDWNLGTMPQGVIPFKVLPKTVTDKDSAESVWGAVDETTASVNSIFNGHVIADLEYFCMGNRGDQYRMMGWPNIVKTNYMVDPSKTYDVLDIHYAYTGANESVQKSEKDLTIVAPTDTPDSKGHTIMNAIIAKFNAATGLSVATLSD